MIRITYISQATGSPSADALLELLSQCHRNNAARGLTGMLLFGNGTFLQCLEGEQADVDALLGKIAADPRHTGMKVLRRDAIAARQYSEWSMGFEQVTEGTLARVPGLRDFGLSHFNPGFLESHGEVVETLLERHRAPHWDPLVREIDARDRLIADLRQELARARNDTQLAALVIETVVEVAADGRLDSAHLELCRTTLRSLR